MNPTSSSDAAAGERTTTPLQKLVLLAFGLALAGLVVLLVEGSLRMFGIGDQLVYEDPFVGFVPGRDVFKKVEKSSGQLVYTTFPEKLAFFNRQEFSADKRTDTYRIFSVGGSTTFGRPYDDTVSFSNWLRIYLEDMDPGRRWEVVNAGGISYASYRIVVLLKELVRYAPDLIIVYTGHNEFLEERTYGEIIHQNLALKRLRIWLNGLRSYSLARRWWLDQRADGGESTDKLSAEVAAKLDDSTGLERYRRDEELRRSVVEHFEYNLQQIARIAGAYDIDLIFVKPVSNLKDFSPFKSEPTSSIGHRESARREMLLSRGWERLEAGEAAAALPLLEEAAKLDPDYAETHFRIGRNLFAMGRFAEARAAFVRAKELDVAPLRALGDLVAVVAQVAAEHDIPLVDLPAILESDSLRTKGHDILGNDYLLDHVHPDIPVHSLIAEKVVEKLVDRGVAVPRSSWSAAVRKGLGDQLLGSLDQRYYAERDLNLAKVLGWAGKVEEAEGPLRRAAEILTDNPEVHLNLGIVLEKQGRWEEASLELERALVLEPELAEAHFNLGVVYGTVGRIDEGIEALSRAIELRSDYAGAHFNLGVLYRRQGTFERALQSLERALELKPEAAETYAQLGVTYRLMESWDEAVSAFERSLQLEPGNVRALAGLGGTDARRGNLDEAMEYLEDAIDRDPSNAEAYFDLAMVLRQLRRSSQAISAYRKAIQIAPGYVEAHNNLGILLAEEGELESASRELIRATEVDPRYAEAFFNLGVVYDSAGHGDHAVRAIQRALELEPDNPRFHLALGLIFKARGRGQEALHHLQLAHRDGAEVPAEIRRWMESQ